MKNIAKIVVATMTILLLFSSCDKLEEIKEITAQQEASTPSPAQAPTSEETDDTPINDQASRDPIIIPPQQAEEMMAHEGAIILDVRTQAEFDAGHIEHAILLPYNEISALASSTLPDKTQTILIYCRTGRRSNIAAWALADMGYIAVYDFGGIESWHGPIIVTED